MIRIAAILILLTGILRGQSVVETELFRIHYSAEVSPAMQIATTKAATMLGWMVDRPIPLDAPAPYNTGRAVLFVYAQSGMGWTIAETSVIGPIHVINGRSVPLRPTITINSDNWDALGDTFTWGDQGAVDVMFHELIHALGAWVCGTTAWTVWNAIADETHWFGEQGLAYYRAEIDPAALFIPLQGWQHVENSVAPFAITTNIMETRLGYYPQMVCGFELAMLRDVGIATAPTESFSLSDLYNRRRSPWGNNSASIVSPPGIILPTQP
jgi:hypothetical protein